MADAKQISPPPEVANVRMKFRSGPLAVRAALAHILSELRPMNAREEELGTVEIVLAEALNNIVEHAYPKDEEAGPIDIDCRPDGELLHVRIIDWGSPMPGGQLPEGIETDVDTELLDLPEGGFGWFLIHELASDVSYQRDGDKNVLNMQLVLALP